MSNVLGTNSFLDTPDVNGTLVLLVGDAVQTLNGTTNQITISGTNPTKTAAIADNPVLPGLQRVKIPAGATADRPGAPTAGDLRFNTTTVQSEIYNGTAWTPPGILVQCVTGSIPATSGTTQVPTDTTVPTSTEGIQIWTQAFTPLYSTSRIIITFALTLSHATVPRTFTTSVFAGTTNIGCTLSSNASANVLATSNLAIPATVHVVYSPGSTAAITFSARSGANGSNTLFVNQLSGGQTQGGAMVTEYTIMEIL